MLAPWTVLAPPEVVVVVDVVVPPTGTVLASAAASVVAFSDGVNQVESNWSLKKPIASFSLSALVWSPARLTISTLMAPSWRSFSNVASMPTVAQYALALRPTEKLS